jgi:hypothetical protein
MLGRRWTDRVAGAKFASPATYRLSKLAREPLNERVLEVSGFLAMVNDAEGRDSMDSDLDLVNAGAGYTSPTLPSVSSRLKIGNDGSSLPGR